MTKKPIYFCYYICVLGAPVTRKQLGLPDESESILEWWMGPAPQYEPRPAVDKPYKKKCPEIPSLVTYEKPPQKTFWNTFPKNTSTRTIHTPVKYHILKQYVQCYSNRWVYRQKAIAKLSLQNISEGTKAQLKTTLPGITCKNASSAFKNGEMITDSIAHWVKNRFVAGPFHTPPLQNFRSNMLMAKKEKTKVRPILNLSSPKGSSFNDAIDKTCLLKLTMSSPSIFGQLLLALGQGAKFAKIDLTNAYKLIPVNPADWKYYGFRWLGMHFYESNTAFGNCTAPAEFDPLPDTINAICKTIVNIHPQWVLRQLDDTIFAAPAYTHYAEQYYNTFRTVCNNLGVPLADLCPEHVKAFAPSTYGTVLGIEFNSVTLTWKYPNSKIEETLFLLKKVTEGENCSLQLFQSLHGKLNDFAQMCTFLKGFRFLQNKQLQQYAKQKVTTLPVLPPLKEELYIWIRCIIDTKGGLPIPQLVSQPPLFPVTYISDAAGAALLRTRGMVKNISRPRDRGVASVGFVGDRYYFACIYKWPKKFLDAFPSKSMFFESVGLLLPFLCTPKLLVGKNILLYVDNDALPQSWLRRMPRRNEHAAIVLRTLHMLEAILPCRIFIQYQRRCSTEAAKLVDRLSRQSTTTPEDYEQLQHLHIHTPKGPFIDWLSQPEIDWALPKTTVQYINNMLYTSL